MVNRPEIAENLLDHMDVPAANCADVVCSRRGLRLGGSEREVVERAIGVED